MIVRMKEIWLFSSSKKVDSTIHQLGELGVVDIKEVSGLSSDIADRRRQAVERTQEAINILQEYETIGNQSGRTRYSAGDPKLLVDRILQSGNLRKSCQERIDYLEARKAWYECWGKDLVVQDIEELSRRGIYLRLYLLNKPPDKSIKENHTLETFASIKGKTPTVLITQDIKEKLPYKEESIPKLSYQSILSQLERKERQLAELDHFLTDQIENIGWLEDYLKMLQDRLNRRQALDGMGDVEGRIKYLKGYIPKTAVKEFKEEADRNKWGYQIDDPQNPEEVPVYIKNPKWIGIINPLMKFIDIVPGYKEVDVSIYFLVAFALFFAMLVGDAGYGLIFLLITFMLRKKMPGQIRVLSYVLSASTLIWGVLSGTYFGAEQIAQLPFLRDLVIPNMASFGVDNVSFMMHLSFMIGAIHLTLAHSIRAMQFINSLKALSEIGWISLVWGLFLVTEQLVLGKEMPSWGLWLFGAGAILVAFFSFESKNLGQSIGISVANLPLSLISGFSDIVSYVRLFAVGMATAAVAASFNNMILPEGATPGIIGMIMAAVGLLLGHTLNIVLALMAVMVHGIRLNMLEFAGHLGVQFSGEAYEPFKLKNNGEEYQRSIDTSFSSK